MRHFAAAGAVALVTLTQSADADDEAAKKLIGSWRLISFEVQVIGESTEHKDMLGPEPFGRIIVTPEHTMATYIAKQSAQRAADERR